MSKASKRSKDRDRKKRERERAAASVGPQRDDIVPMSERLDATPERLRHAGHDHEKGAADKIRRISDWPLARLYRRGQLDADPGINKSLFDAGEAFADHWQGAGLSGYSGVDLNRSGGGDGEKAYLMPTSEYAARCRGELRVAHDIVGDRGWSILVLVCAEGQTVVNAGLTATKYVALPQATAVALDRLTDALTRLARHWGYIAPVRSARRDVAA